MTQRVFDIENEWDMQDLWSILPDKITKITKPEIKGPPCFSGYDSMRTSDLIKINWHNKTEITRPIQEATEEDIGKLCVFYDSEKKEYGILTEICNAGGNTGYRINDEFYFRHCRRLTEQEIKELC